jgi:hypothetical protein
MIVSIVWIKTSFLVPFVKIGHSSLFSFPSASVHLIVIWGALALELLLPYLNGIESSMFLSLDRRISGPSFGFLVRLFLFLNFLANRELMSGQFYNKASLSRLSSLENLLSCDVEVLVILIQMSYAASLGHEL